MNYPTLAHGEAPFWGPWAALLSAALGAMACIACSGAAASDGAGMGQGGNMASTLTIDDSNGKYSLAFGQTYIQIDPANGARITQLRVGGATGADVILGQPMNNGDDNWGSTFWPSPQTWSWPPTASASIGAINSGAYTVTQDAASVTFTSGVDATTNLQVTKKFSADLAKEAIVIDYTMRNAGSTVLTVAPWEITRMGMGSITFYPQGSGAPMPGGTFDLPPFTSGAGATWFQHTGSTTQYKLLSDGTGGWLASAVGDQILVKTFPDIPEGAAATGEAEIEIYSAETYVEVEEQGAVQSLMPGASLNWTVRWYARRMSAPAAVGSADLVNYVQNLIK